MSHNYYFYYFRRFSNQDESTGSILSPSDISYDNTEEDLVGILILNVVIIVIVILLYNKIISLTQVTIQ